jgi:hypothetical protein
MVTKSQECQPQLLINEDKSSKLCGEEEWDFLNIP